MNQPNPQNPNSNNHSEKQHNQSSQKNSNQPFGMPNWNEMVLEMMNYDKVRAQMTRSIQAATAASQLTVEAAQTTARLSSDNLQKSAQNNIKFMNEMLSAKSPQDLQSLAQEVMNQAMATSTEQSKHLSEVWMKACKEANNTMSQRANELMSELGNGFNFFKYGNK